LTAGSELTAVEEVVAGRAAELASASSLELEHPTARPANATPIKTRFKKKTDFMIVYSARLQIVCHPGPFG
jgi:hypothetical protein